MLPVTNWKAVIQAALPGWKGLLAGHHVSYLANGNVHRGVPYVATNLAVMKQKLALMQAAGFDIVLSTWQGIYAPSSNLDVVMMAPLCADYGMKFAFVLDPWCAKLSAKGTTAPSTANVAASLAAASTQAILNGSTYLSPKYILDFGTGANLSTLAGQFKNLVFLAKNQGFSWITIPTEPNSTTPITNSTLRNAAAISVLKAQNGNPAMKIPSVCTEFNDAGQPLPPGVSTQSAFNAAGGARNYAQSVWSPYNSAQPESETNPSQPARVMESFAGQFFLQQLAVTPVSAPIIAIVTIDDYDEQSSGPLEKRLAEEAGLVWAS